MESRREGRRLIPNSALFVIAMLPAVTLALIQELILLPMFTGSDATGAVPEISWLTRLLIAYANTVMRFEAWVFLIGPALVAVLAVLNQRARVNGQGPYQGWLWAALCVGFWGGSNAVVTVDTLYRSGDWALLLDWMSLVAGSIALGEGFTTQRLRRESGRSTWSAGFFVFLGVVSSMFHPLVLALASITPSLIWRSEQRQPPESRSA